MLWFGHTGAGCIYTECKNSRANMHIQGIEALILHVSLKQLRCLLVQKSAIRSRPALPGLPGIFTFKPEISEIAAARRRRGPDELSTGDALRRLSTRVSQPMFAALVHAVHYVGNLILPVIRVVAACMNLLLPLLLMLSRPARHC